MSKLEFTEADFKSVTCEPELHSEFDRVSYAALAAVVANRRLAEMLSAAPIVYGNADSTNPNAPWAAQPIEFDWHRARLVNVEKLDE